MSENNSSTEKIQTRFELKEMLCQGCLSSSQIVVKQVYQSEFAKNLSVSSFPLYSQTWTIEAKKQRRIDAFRCDYIEGYYGYCV